MDRISNCDQPLSQVQTIKNSNRRIINATTVNEAAKSDNHGQHSNPILHLK